MNMKQLFNKFYNANTETEIDEEVKRISTDKNVSWKPYGNQDNNLGIIENQQAYAIGALVEKITNSIDAILMRRCYEEGIDPKGSKAPQTINKAVERFFNDSKNWDLSGKQSKQAESIQILAVGRREDRQKDTSLIIYDDGEGQNPEDFEDTFLSLLKSNKNEIQFVQGKFNMGGTGALRFCGNTEEKRYQLIASKRYDKKGKFGFTIIRKHTLDSNVEKAKNTWYEYLLYNGKIPEFKIEELDLNLFKRTFTTGTIIKLYSYNLPPNSKSVISRDLNQSINELLFEPALPIYTIDTKKRYPKDVNPERYLYGLKRRLQSDESTYIEDSFCEYYQNELIGDLKIYVYVFKKKIDGKPSKVKIRREFFKNRNSVMFLLNGQVHGSIGSGFITQTLKFNILKDHLLIYVDCTNLESNFRSGLFMASRDRLNQSPNYYKLKDIVSKILRDGRLKEINKEWKNSFLSMLSDTDKKMDELLDNYRKSLQKDRVLNGLLSNTIPLNNKLKGSRNNEKTNKTKKNIVKEEIPFNSKRFPTRLTIDKKKDNADQLPLYKIPLGGDKNIFFSTDADDKYFEREDESGEFKITFLSPSKNESGGGTSPGIPNNPDQVAAVTVSDPSKGKIRINIKPKNEVNIGDKIKIKVSLTSPEGDLEQIFMVQISDKENSNKLNTNDKNVDADIQFPKCVKVYKNSEEEDSKSWNDIPNGMGHKSVIRLLVGEDNILETIFINMDSSIFKDYISNLKLNSQLEAAKNHYISSVFLHTIHLYSIAINRKYQISMPDSDKSDDLNQTDISEFIEDIFDSYYALFLLNFKIDRLIDTLND